MDLTQELILILIFKKIEEDYGMDGLCGITNPYVKNTNKFDTTEIQSNLQKIFVKLQQTFCENKNRKKKGKKNQENQRSFIEEKRRHLILLNDLDPTFPRCNVQTYPIMLYGNIIREEELVKSLDFCFGDLDVINYGIQIIPAKTKTPSIGQKYAGFLMCYLTLNGKNSCLLDVDVEKKQYKKYDLNTKSFLMHPSTSVISFSNESDEDLILLRVDIKNVLNGTNAIINNIMIKIFESHGSITEACYKTS